MVASDLMMSIKRDGDGDDISGYKHDGDGHENYNRIMWAASIAVATLAGAYVVLRRKR